MLVKALFTGMEHHSEALRKPSIVSHTISRRRTGSIVRYESRSAKPSPSESGQSDGSGQLAWTVDLGSFVLSPAISAHGRIFIATMGGSLAALDVHGTDITTAWTIETGEVRWTVPRGDETYPRPSIQTDSPTTAITPPPCPS